MAATSLPARSIGSRIPPNSRQAVTNDPNASFQRIETEHFVILTQAGKDWNRSAGATLESFSREFRSAFRDWGVALAEPAGKLTWVCFDGYDRFDDYARRADHIDSSWTSGYYSPRTNRVAVVDPDLQRIGRGSANDRPANRAGAQVAAGIGQFDMARLRHEAAHQLAFNCGLQTRGVMYPFWLSEGLATNFEADSDASHGDSIRACQLLQAARDERLMPLADLIRLTAPPGSEREIGSAYLQAWGLFRFLVQTRPRQMRAYLTTLARLRPGRRPEACLVREFTAAFGDLPTIQREWTRYAGSPDSGRLLK